MSFPVAGRHQHRAALDYQPGWPNAVTSSSQHVFVAQGTPPAIHTYTWGGESLASVDHEDLGLQREDFIKGVQWVEGDQLILAVGTEQGVHTLCAYKVGAIVIIYYHDNCTRCRFMT
jgi:hypothetical protein